MPSLRNGAASESPPRVSSATRAICAARTRLPMVFSTIFSAGSSDTPLLTSVPSVRANRPSAADRKTGPMSGIFNLNLSHAVAPAGVCSIPATRRRQRRDAGQNQKPVRVQRVADFAARISVGSGSTVQHFLQHAEQPRQHDRQQNRHRDHAEAQARTPDKPPPPRLRRALRPRAPASRARSFITFGSTPASSPTRTMLT